MARKYIRTKVWLNEKKTKYCTVLLFGSMGDMQAYYREHCPHEEQDPHCKGVSIHYTRIDAESNTVLPESGTVLLNMEYCGASVTCHELLHAVLWAHNHDLNKAENQYPIAINNMQEEEQLLINFSFALYQYYNWYYKYALQRFTDGHKKTYKKL